MLELESQILEETLEADNSFKDSVLYTNYNSHLKDFPRNKQLDVLNESLNLTKQSCSSFIKPKGQFFY
jgi:hypothetical protein